MSWVVLFLSGVLEAVWAAALSASHGFRRWKPTVVFIAALVLSMAGLAWAMIDLPTGTAYAVWVGTGATLTVGWAVVTGRERADTARVLLLALLIVSVVGLKVVS
ncbi:multidrug efflux SMR transporter [Nocardia sp. NPDC004568]|uniref:DMT family transporter n=1 Tax=Nocardia sp. NPDC004568 TaxID=3154551 RepID=UPI0033BDC7FA